MQALISHLHMLVYHKRIELGSRLCCIILLEHGPEPFCASAKEGHQENFDSLSLNTCFFFHPLHQNNSLSHTTQYPHVLYSSALLLAFECFCSLQN